MTVKCKVNECPWILPSGFCIKGFVFMNEAGMCNWLYNEQGQVRPNWKDKGIVVTKEKEKTER